MTHALREAVEAIWDHVETARWLGREISPHMAEYYDIELSNLKREIDSLGRAKRLPANDNERTTAVNETPRREIYRHPTFPETCSVAVPDFDQISLELIEHLSKHPEDLQKLKWRRFEELLDAVFKNQGYQTVLGPGSGDKGVDLRLVQKDTIGELVTLVQAKRYDPRYPIKLEAVASLYGVVEREKANRGLFVSTSEYVQSARSFAEATNSRIVLAGTEEIVEWCRLVTNTPQ